MKWISFVDGTIREGEEEDEGGGGCNKNSWWTPMQLVAAEMGWHVNTAMQLARSSDEEWAGEEGTRLATPPELAMLKAQELLHSSTFRCMMCSRSLGRELLKRAGGKGKAAEASTAAASNKKSPRKESAAAAVNNNNKKHSFLLQQVVVPPQKDIGRPSSSAITPQGPVGPMSTWTWDPDSVPISIVKMPRHLYDKVQRGLKSFGGKYLTPTLHAFLKESLGHFTTWYDTREGNMQLDRERGTGGGSSNTHQLQEIMLRQMLFVCQMLSGEPPSWKVLMDPAQVAAWVAYLMTKEVKGSTLATYMERLTKFQNFIGTRGKGEDRPTTDYSASLIKWTRRVTCHFRALSKREGQKNRDTIMEKKEAGR